MDSSSLLPFLIGILVVGGLLVFVLMITRRSHKQLDMDKYRSKWMTIEQALRRDDPSSHVLCVLNADKLLDQALKERGTTGETMGERMKNEKTTWSNANAVWSAHKLRNQIAHEADAKVSYDDTRRALSAFKQGLKDIGAI